MFVYVVKFVVGFTLLAGSAHADNNVSNHPLTPESLDRCLKHLTELSLTGPAIDSVAAVGTLEQIVNRLETLPLADSERDVLVLVTALFENRISLELQRHLRETANKFDVAFPELLASLNIKEDRLALDFVAAAPRHRLVGYLRVLATWVGTRARVQVLEAPVPRVSRDQYRMSATLNLEPDHSNLAEVLNEASQRALREGPALVSDIGNTGEMYVVGRSHSINDLLTLTGHSGGLRFSFASVSEATSQWSQISGGLGQNSGRAMITDPAWPEQEVTIIALPTLQQALRAHATGSIPQLVTGLPDDISGIIWGCVGSCRPISMPVRREVSTALAPAGTQPTGPVSAASGPIVTEASATETRVPEDPDADAEALPSEVGADASGGSPVRPLTGRRSQLTEEQQALLEAFRHAETGAYAELKKVLAGSRGAVGFFSPGAMHTVFLRLLGHLQLPDARLATARENLSKIPFRRKDGNNAEGRSVSPSLWRVLQGLRVVAEAYASYLREVGETVPFDIDRIHLRTEILKMFDVILRRSGLTSGESGYAETIDAIAQSSEPAPLPPSPPQTAANIEVVANRSGTGLRDVENHGSFLLAVDVRPQMDDMDLSPADLKELIISQSYDSIQSAAPPESELPEGETIHWFLVRREAPGMDPELIGIAVNQAMKPRDGTIPVVEAVFRPTERTRRTYLQRVVRAGDIRAMNLPMANRVTNATIEMVRISPEALALAQLRDELSPNDIQRIFRGQEPIEVTQFDENRWVSFRFETRITDALGRERHLNVYLTLDSGGRGSSATTASFIQVRDIR